MKRCEAITKRIQRDYTRPGQTAEPVFDTLLRAHRYLTIWKITNADGECYAVHENTEPLDTFETRQEADSFAKEYFNTSHGF